MEKSKEQERLSRQEESNKIKSQIMEEITEILTDIRDELSKLRISMETMQAENASHRMSVKEYARHHKLTEQHVRSMCRRGLLNCEKVNKKYVVII